MAQAQPYDRKFYQTQKSGSYRSACVFVPLVRALIPVGSVCDVGCGAGTWLRCWREHGVEDVLGFDGDYVDKNQLAIPEANFRSAELRQPVRCDRQFDLAMSMEVAEHLPPERAEGFVADLVALAPVVLFSAAVPGQGGTHHINERWQSYWADLFDQAGFVTFDVLRPQIWDDETADFWYRQNALLFCRRDAVAAYPALTAAPTTMPLRVVHPDQYAMKNDPVNSLSVRQSLMALRAAVRRSAVRRVRHFWPEGGMRANV
jgi:SAM-dependent methyltransferase